MYAYGQIHAHCSCAPFCVPYTLHVSEFTRIYLDERSGAPGRSWHIERFQGNVSNGTKISARWSPSFRECSSCKHSRIAPGCGEGVLSFVTDCVYFRCYSTHGVQCKLIGQPHGQAQRVSPYDERYPTHRKNQLHPRYRSSSTTYFRLPRYLQALPIPSTTMTLRHRLQCQTLPILWGVLGTTLCVPARPAHFGTSYYRHCTHTRCPGDDAALPVHAVAFRFR